MIQMNGMASIAEEKTSEALSKILVWNVLSVLIVIIITCVMGTCIVRMDEIVHECQYEIEYGKEIFISEKQYHQNLAT